MSSPTRTRRTSSPPSTHDANPTYAAFSPYTDLHSPSLSKQRATIIVHQKSPLLVATPPQITRALAYSHVFIGPLNKFFALLSWTDKDPWESFLLVASFWLLTLYGDFAIRWAGPVVAVAALIFGMYLRRYSMLSSTSWSGEKGSKHKQSEAEATRQHKSLDGIVEDLKLFTSRCNILLDPFLRMTEFLSTQSTATSATTRPALTILSFRILLVTPVWILLTLPPLHIVTTKRVVLAIGTVILTWHSRPARVCRIVLWRSRSVRRACTVITGLDLETPRLPVVPGPSIERSPRKGPKTPNEVAASMAAKRGPEQSGIRFTFTLYENQRRWLGIGWTASMLAYERASWTDEHNNAATAKDKFYLPTVEGGMAKWRWVAGSEWRIEGVKEQDPQKAEEDEEGWIYYDNKWKDGRRGKDGWGRYTRRRKWLRDAELIELTPSTTPQPQSRTPPRQSQTRNRSPQSPPLSFDNPKDLRAAAAALSETNLPALNRTSTSTSRKYTDDDISDPDRTLRRKPWFRRPSNATHGSGKSGEAGSFADSSLSAGSGRSRDDGEDLHSPFQQREESSWLSEDARMGLG